MRSLALPLVGLLALAGCSRDLEVPERGGPIIASITPGSAFAGEWVAIGGNGFAADPSANLVQFASASARGEAFDDSGALLVHVPDDAGTGFFTVTTTLGTSEPAGPFDYRGLGQLRTEQVAGKIELLHKPYKVLAAAGETFLDSDLIVGLVRYGDPDFVAPFAQTSAALPWANAIAWYEKESGTARLVRMALPGGATVTGPAAGEWRNVHLVAQRSPDRLGVFRRSQAANPDATPPAPALPSTLTLHDATTLAVSAAAVSLPLPVPHGCDDAGLGRFVCVYHDAFDTPGKLALVTPGPTTTTTTITPPAALAHNDYDLEEDDPLCVATGAAGHHVAVVGLADGRLLVADLDVVPVTFTFVSTLSLTHAQSLTCSGSTALVAKTGDDLLLAVNVATGAIGWAASVPHAARMAVDSDGATVHVASDANNVVELRSLSTGTLLGRRAFDPLPGRDDGLGLQGAAWIPGGVQAVPVVEMVTGFPRGIMEVPVEQTSGATSVYPIYLEFRDGVGVIPGYGGEAYYIALLEQGIYVSAFNVGEVDVARPVQLGLDGPVDFYVATDDGLVTVSSNGSSSTLSPIPGAEFRSIGLHPDGGLWAAVHRQTGTSSFENAVRRWTESAASAGAAATATYDADGYLEGAAVLNGTLWAFVWNGSSDEAVELSSSMTELRRVDLGDYLNQVLAVSPNGRTFVSWESQPFSENTSIVVWSADPDAGFPRRATIPIDGQITGATFDATGEKLYVLARDPGRIVVIE